MRLGWQPAWPLSPLQTAAHLPLLALPSAASCTILPHLYESYQPAAPADNLGPLLLLLLAKRVTLYACAITTVYVAAMRSSDAPSGLGERLEQITAEAVRPGKMPAGQAAEVRAVTKQLDETPQAAQAAGLPLLFGALLASSYAFNVLLNQAPPPDQAQLPTAEMGALFRGIFEKFQPLSTASVCLFAVNAEVQATVRALTGGRESTDDDDATPIASYAAAAAALACVSTAYLLGPSVSWPAQNVVNSCVAISVARVLQLPSLPAILAAIGGLALYDGFGTIFAVAAAEPVTGSSVMESVALSKLGSAGAGVWQPGLLTVVLHGRVTDGLGLGDVLAPAMLAGWCRRFDLQQSATAVAGGGADEENTTAENGGFLSAALGGYAVGCVLLEVAPPELTRAALLFLVPSTAAAVLFRLAERKVLPQALAGSVAVGDGESQSGVAEPGAESRDARQDPD